MDLTNINPLRDEPVQLHWTENRKWEETEVKHVWHDTTNNKYHFSDEASMLDETAYDTLEEAKTALFHYISWLG